MPPFKCQKCGACCRIKNGIVRVSDEEIRRIAAFLGKEEASFIAEETELAPDRRGLVLKSRPDGACTWLTSDNLCRINPVKPDKCRTFPQEWRNSDSAIICPALNGQVSANGDGNMDTMTTILSILKANCPLGDKAFCFHGYQGKPDVGRSKQAPFYFMRREDSLIGYPNEEHLSQILQGAGREWDKDIFALRSSCALAFNIFGNGHVFFHKEGRLPLAGQFTLEYEKKLPTLLPIEAKKAYPAHVDVWLKPCADQNSEVFFEVKKLEWLEKKKRQLSSNYLNSQHYKATKSLTAVNAFIDLFKAITDSQNRQCRWKRYDALQMAKHLLGIYNYSEHNAAHSPNVILVNCIWELGDVNSITSPRVKNQYKIASEQESQEFEEFAEQIKRIVPVFKSELGITLHVMKMSVQELIGQMAREEPTDWKERLVTTNCL